MYAQHMRKKLIHKMNEMEMHVCFTGRKPYEVSYPLTARLATLGLRRTQISHTGVYLRSSVPPASFAIPSKHWKAKEHRMRLFCWHPAA